MALLRDKVSSLLGDGREVVVRSATARDAGVVGQLLDEVAGEPEGYVLLIPGQFGRREWKDRIVACRRDAVSLFVVAEVESRLAGVAGLQADPHPAAAHVRQLGMSVRRESRSTGVGSAVITALLGWAREQGVVKIELGVFSHNEAAQRFYRRHGFADEGLRRSHYSRDGRLLDEVIMGLMLLAPPGASGAAATTAAGKAGA